MEVKAETIIHPTLPNTTIRDYSKPSIVFEGDEGYQTLPNTTIRDYSKPKYIRDRPPRRDRYDDQEDYEDYEDYDE